MIIDLCTFKKAVRNILQFRAYILSVKKRSQVCSDMFTTPVGNNKSNELELMISSFDKCIYVNFNKRKTKTFSYSFP